MAEYPADRSRRVRTALALAGGGGLPAGYVWPLRRRKRKAPGVPRRRIPRAATTQSVPIAPTGFLAPPYPRRPSRQPRRAPRPFRRITRRVSLLTQSVPIAPTGFLAPPYPRRPSRQPRRAPRPFRRITRRILWVELRQCLEPMFAQGIFVRDGPARARLRHNTSPGGTVVQGAGTFVRSGPARSTFYRDRC